jgi:hypothetical protein
MRFHSSKVHSKLLVVLSELLVVLSKLLAVLSKLIVLLQDSKLSVLGPDELGLELVPHSVLADQLCLYINHASADVQQLRLNLGRSSLGISCLLLRLYDSQIG